MATSGLAAGSSRQRFGDTQCRKSRLSGLGETTYHSDVRQVRRLAAMALQGALLTMWSVGSGFACELGTSHAAHMAMDAMLVSEMPMDMPGMPGMPGHGQANDAPAGSTDSHSDCEFPWSSGDCEGMTSCAPNAVAADDASVLSVTPRAHEEPVWRTDQLRSVGRSPETPPPRA